MEREWLAAEHQTPMSNTSPPSGRTPILQVRNLRAVFQGVDGSLHALEDISFEVSRQQFLCVLGPSGSGKSTLLRMLGGLLRPTGGEVLFEGALHQQPSRQIGIVFQDPNLMPWRTVIENITLPLEVMGVPPAEAEDRARAFVDLVGLKGFADWFPRDLSGGMAQRVAIARALIYNPKVLLLDEPFGALDALTRERMGIELLRIWQGNRKTVIMVTHSISEALLLADRILVLTPRPGTICLDLEVDLPRPRHEEVRYTPHFVELARSLRQAITETS